MTVEQGSISTSVEEYLQQCSKNIRDKWDHRWSISEDEVELGAFLSLFNNFPCKLFDSNGKRGRRILANQRISGRTREEFERDLDSSVEESGVDKIALGQYVDVLLEQGLLAGNGKSFRELILPVFIKMREKGYTESNLAT